MGFAFGLGSGAASPGPREPAEGEYQTKTSRSDIHRVAWPDPMAPDIASAFRTGTNITYT